MQKLFVVSELPAMLTPHAAGMNMAVSSPLRFIFIHQTPVDESAHGLHNMYSPAAAQHAHQLSKLLWIYTDKQACICSICLFIIIVEVPSYSLWCG